MNGPGSLEFDCLLPIRPFGTRPLGEKRDTAEIVLEWNDRSRDFGEIRSEQGGFASANDRLEALIRDEPKREAKVVIIESQREAIKSGPAEPMTREEWDSIEREAIERITREKAIS